MKCFLKVSTVKTFLYLCDEPEETRQTEGEKSLRIDRLERRIEDCILVIYDLGEDARDDVFSSE